MNRMAVGFAVALGLTLTVIAPQSVAEPSPQVSTNITILKTAVDKGKTEYHKINILWDSLCPILRDYQFDVNPPQREDSWGDRHEVLEAAQDIYESAVSRIKQNTTDEVVMLPTDFYLAIKSQCNI